MRPPNMQPPPLPVRVLRMECLIQCPTCREGIGFLHLQPVEPGNGFQVECPKCRQKLGLRLDAVNLGKPTIISG